MLTTDFDFHLPLRGFSGSGVASVVAFGTLDISSNRRATSSLDLVLPTFDPITILPEILLASAYSA
jgi:hypothetical protein